MKQLSTYIRAGISCIQIITSEEERAIDAIKKMAKNDLKTDKKPSGYNLWSWSVTKGLRDEYGSLVSGDKEEIQKSKDPVVAISLFMTGNVPSKSIVLLKDFHMYLKMANPMLIRLLREAIAWGRQTNRHLIILGCQLNMQPELEKEIQSIDFPLPDKQELGNILDKITKSSKSKLEVNGSRDKIIDAMVGLTINEAEDAALFSVSSLKKIDADAVRKIKVDTIKRNGIVEIIESDVDMSSVGGMSATKEWLAKRVKAFSKEALEFGLSAPKGLLMIGPSGTGKSAIAKVMASAMNISMLRIDGGSVFAGFVGESERNMRKVIQTAEAMAPCVLLWDEIEKSLSGGASSGVCDGGTTSRVISTFLQWMNDKIKPVFVVATANDISQLPPETLRRGRFDQIFFVDLPDEEDRKQIWSIHIHKVGRKTGKFDLKQLAEKTDGFTGAEIESIVLDGLFNAFHLGKELDTEILLEAIQETIPISSTMREKIEQMRKWAKGRALNASGKAYESTKKPS